LVKLASHKSPKLEFRDRSPGDLLFFLDIF
jgi:hypothetical protein